MKKDQALETAVERYLHGEATKDDVAEAAQRKVCFLAERYYREFISLQSIHAVEDWQSNIYLVLLKALDRFDPGRGVSFSTYLEKLSDNMALNEVKKHSTHSRLANTRAAFLADVQDYPESDLVRVEEQDIYGNVDVTLTLETMGLDRRQMEICQGLMDGYSKVEIASRLGTSGSNITNITKRLQRRFREAGLHASCVIVCLLWTGPMLMGLMQVL